MTASIKAPVFVKTVLAAVVLGGLALRLWGIDWGLPDTYYADETTVVGVAVRFGTGDLNPHNFRYPTLWPYVLFGAYGITFLAGRLTGHIASLHAFQEQYFRDPTLFYLVGRGLSAVLGTLTIYLTYRLGARLFSRTTGLIAAAVLAVSPLHVLFSHLLVTDVPLTFVVLAALLAIVRMTDRPGSGPTILAGGWTGLAISVKYPGAGLLPALLWVQARLSRRMIPLALAAVAVGFLLGTPYALLDLSAFRYWITYHWTISRQVQAEVTSGLNGWWYYLGTVLPRGLGQACAWLGLLGFGLIAVRAVRMKMLPLQAVLLLPLAVYPIFANSTTPYPRFMLPILPVMAILAAEALVTLCGYFVRWGGAWRDMGLGVGACIILAQPLSVSFCGDQRMAGPDTRAVAAAWVVGHVPDRARIAVELYGPTLPLDPVQLESEVRELERLAPASPEAKRQKARTSAKLAALRQSSSQGPRFTLRRFDLEPLQMGELPYRVEALRQAGIEYVITNSLMTERLRHWSDTGAPALYAFLERTAAKVAEFDPGGSPAPVGFENYEFWMASCDRDRTGPLIRVYRLPPLGMRGDGASEMER